jgi:hypothetical protein
MAEGFGALTSPIPGFVTIRAEVFDCLVVTPLGIVHAAMALFPGSGFCGGGSGEKQKTAKSDGCECLGKNRRETQRRKSHKASRACPGWLRD